MVITITINDIDNVTDWRVMKKMRKWGRECEERTRERARERKWKTKDEWKCARENLLKDRVRV